MTKKQIAKLKAKYNHECIYNNQIEMVEIGIYIETREEIPEIEAALKEDQYNAILKEYTGWETIIYKVYEKRG